MSSSADRRLVRVHCGCDGAWHRRRSGGMRGKLRQSLDLHGTGKKTAADGTVARSPLKPRPQARAAVPAREDETPEQTIDPLQARVRELEA